jgi:hypothetical protein
MEASVMTTEEDTPQRRFFTALFRTHILDWTVAQHLKALDGYQMRLHVEQAHPDQVAHVRTLMVGELTAAAMAVGEPSAPLVEAYLYGYDFRDTNATGDAALDGPPAAETREP